LWCPFSNGWDDNLLSCKIMMLSVVTRIYIMTLEMSTLLWIISSTCPFPSPCHSIIDELPLSWVCRELIRKYFECIAVKKEEKISPLQNCNLEWISDWLHYSCWQSSWPLICNLDDKFSSWIYKKRVFSLGFRSPILKIKKKTKLLDFRQFSQI
jgi:hypothetical protein